MTRDDIIRMAREAALTERMTFNHWWNEGGVSGNNPYTHETAAYWAENASAVWPDNTAVYVRRGSSPKIGEQLGEQELKADGWRRCAIGQGETQPTFQEKMAKEEKESEAFWNSLSAEQQLQAFCAVMRRIYRGEIEEGRTYRGMLYDVFKFPPKSYAIAQMSGFLTIHNCIWWAVRDTVAAAEETAIRARGQQ